MNPQTVVEFVAALVVGALLYRLFLKPLAAQTCLLDHPDCVRLKRQTMGDAFLVDIPDSGETLWYNGESLVAYNIPSGDVCKVGDPGYAWLASGEQGFFCVKPLAAVRALFERRPLRPWSRKLGKGQRSATAIAQLLGADFSRRGSGGGGGSG